MRPTNTDVNAGFGVPPEVEAVLRAQAQAEVEKSVDTEKLFAKFKAEALAKIEAEARQRAADDLAEETAAPDLDKQGFPKKYFEINIAMGPNKTDLSYVPVGVNGFVWQIRRGEWVPVPSVVVDGLNEAVTEAVVQSEGGLITRPVLRFPFQSRECSEEKYLAYKAKNRTAGKTAVAA